MVLPKLLRRQSARKVFVVDKRNPKKSCKADDDQANSHSDNTRQRSSNRNKRVGKKEADDSWGDDICRCHAQRYRNGKDAKKQKNGDVDGRSARIFRHKTCKARRRSNHGNNERRHQANRSKTQPLHHFGTKVTTDCRIGPVKSAQDPGTKNGSNRSPRKRDAERCDVAGDGKVEFHTSFSRVQRREEESRAGDQRDIKQVGEWKRQADLPGLVSNGVLQSDAMGMV